MRRFQGGGGGGGPRLEEDGPLDVCTYVSPPILSATHQPITGNPYIGIPAPPRGAALSKGGILLRGVLCYDMECLFQPAERGDFSPAGKNSCSLGQAAKNWHQVSTCLHIR